MRCPHCGSEEDRVVDSRAAQDGRAVRRRRQCLKCEDRFTTYEYVENTSLTVLKGDNRREPFDRQKVLTGIKLSCNKRPISAKKQEALVDEIEARLSEISRNEVESSFIGKLVMEKLKNTDEIAYVRFASVYRRFQDKEEFLNEIKRMLEK
ncbi:transcriptional repressor NrdR [bacterium AH-315-J21]|nr:transcriptional repressor NrdR [bacterium AH-315-J21]